MSKKLFFTMKKEQVKIAKYEFNFLIDKNNNIYARWNDLKYFGICKYGFEQWLNKNNKKREFKNNNIETCTTRENEKAVEIIDAEAISAYTIDTGKPLFFHLLYKALYNILIAEKQEKINTTEVKN